MLMSLHDRRENVLSKHKFCLILLLCNTHYIALLAIFYHNSQLRTTSFQWPFTKSKIEGFHNYRDNPCTANEMACESESSLLIDYSLLTWFLPRQQVLCILELFICRYFHFYQIRYLILNPTITAVVQCINFRLLKNVSHVKIKSWQCKI